MCRDNISKDAPQKMMFKSTVLGTSVMLEFWYVSTVMVMTYSAGVLTASSDNVSTLCIVRSTLSRIWRERFKQHSSSLSMHADAADYVIGRLHSLHDAHHNIVQTKLRLDAAIVCDHVVISGDHEIEDITSDARYDGTCP